MFKRKLKLNLPLTFLVAGILSFCILFSIIIPFGVTATAENEEVYLGGIPIGLTLRSDGLIVLDYKPIITEKGTCFPAKDSGIQVGDLLKRANNNSLNSISDLENAINCSTNDVKIVLIRENKEIELSITPVFDPLAGSKKIGIIVKNDISGIGTLTYVKNNGDFCSLGHKIADPNLNNYTCYQNGDLFNANILGVYKGNKQEAGALKGTFNKTDMPIGKVKRNNEYGVYGTISHKYLINSLKKVKIGTRNEVVPGKAYIYSTIEGNSPQKYEIDIIKATKQQKPDVKSMVIRITDKRLIDSTGGIVQGMSGSPIIQNDKLVGAVTHVLLDDATIGYGVYIDWLL